MGVLLAIIVGVVSLHDLRHLLQCAKVIMQYRLPLFVLSSFVVVVRLVVTWWAYLNNHPWLTIIAAGVGQTLVMLAYGFDVSAMHHAAKSAEARLRSVRYLRKRACPEPAKPPTFRDKSG